jgi:photosystem II stability/assembly factor-like uncharacterized protein
MRRYRLLALIIVLFAAFGVRSLVGQRSETSASGAAAEASADKPFDALHFRPIGPAAMSGRITDLAVYEANPAIYYVGTAHGGVWKTTNAGTTFEPQFQDQGLMSVGDVTVSQSNPDLVWLGSGESNNRQSTSWGDGVYKSTDGGKTFVNVGLRTSRYINRIVIDPRNTDVVFVAATGSLWGSGGERGVYKTTDGGKTWKHVLKVDDDTGANDLVMDPTNGQILYASTYQRRRTACCMNGGGPGSGIWKSTDGGETWTRLHPTAQSPRGGDPGLHPTAQNPRGGDPGFGNGLPDGPLGRIGLDIYRRRPNIIYTLIEGPAPPGGRGRGAAPAAEEAPAQPGGRNMATGVTENLATGLYRSDDGGATWRKLNDENPRPMYFSQVRVDPNDPDVVVYGGVGLHFSSDGGKTVHTDIAASTHDDVHAIWIDPSNSNHMIIGNDGGLAASYDQAKTWVFLPNLPVGLFYHVSYDMATPYHICGGMQDNYVWCGPSAVRGSAGIANFQWQTMQGGDGFVALQDPTDVRIAYSESQDGNMVRIDRVTGETVSIRPQAQPGEPPIRWNWDTPLVMSPHDPKIIYAVGNKVFRSSNRGLTFEAASPDLTSNANRDNIFTMDVKGSDITIARNDGIQTWPTIVSFAESPKRQGILYAGTDDGNVQVSRDTGRSWTNVTDRIPGLPKGAWVSEVAPSRFDEGTVYATFDAHRQNDFETYIYVSRDFGQSWQSANGSLKGEVIKTITEDVKNPDVLYVGAETGLFVSLDRAKTWTRIKANLPTVRIDEIAIHPRDNAMILATHGRAIWILDHLEPIQEYAAAQSASSDAKLFSPPPSVMYRRPSRDRNYEFWGDQTFYGENPPQAAVISWVNRKPVGEVKLRISDATGHEVQEISGSVLADRNKAGIQSACWDLRVQPAPAPPSRGRSGDRAGTEQGRSGVGAGTGSSPSPGSAFGAGCDVPGQGGGGGFFGGGNNTAGPWVLAGVYNIALVVDGKTVDTKPLRVTDDPEVALTSVERKRMFDLAVEMHELQKRLVEAQTALASLNRQMTELTEGTTRAYTEAKSQAPKAVADLNAAIAKAAALSPTLARYNLTLTVPQPVKPLEATPAAKRSSSQDFR